MDASDLTIVVPVYNEEAALPGFLAELTPFAEEHGCRVILVDDGSRDGSAAVLDAIDHAGFSVLHHKVNRGYGGALKTGIAAASTPYVITIDSDGQHDPADVLRLLAKAREADADMIVGSRKGQADAGVLRKLGKFLIRRLAKILMDVPIHDINSGMKIYVTKTAQGVLHLCPDSMAFSDIMTLVFLNNRCRVLEEPITIRPRTEGTSTIGFRTAVETVRAIVSIVMLFRPMNLFFPVAAGTFALGIVWAVRCYLINRVISEGAGLLLLSSLVILLLGFVGEQLAEIRKNLRP